ncbi:MULTISPECIES: PLP-dependent aminotransferase family protein [unclassified Stenotrophomonas]|uniref:aminotransferase-like domain-containing protein n=1 Tax=unclassified Stenotrophomonas TaxID=196198 RepID=UPI000D163695|nr:MULTISPECIES: PLP-dependent aminotransferase family protein [unclassified Stenotrophomonas]PTA70678.1 GntR family transcriptional regulator [Stenotrophomonas sp. Nf1]PTA81255.1 GntR family transcriptional regulator [Stenotrophomonas sp. Nf4]
MTRARYKRLVDRFATDIRAGRLVPGTRLPTHRQLAAKENLALATATRVYAELESMGLVKGEIGRGTFVREHMLSPNHGLDQQAVAADLIDLSFNYPALPEQTELLRAALRQLASSGELDALLRYQPHAGRMQERVTVARHLARSGLSVDPDRVLIVSGAQHGLAVVTLALLQPGDVVAVDALTYPGFKTLAEQFKLELVPVPTTATGMDLDALERLCQKRTVRALYTMPTVHNPLGWVLDLASRQRLVTLTHRYGLILIEDAPYAFLEQNPPPPLAALAPEVCVHVGGLSKNVATGLRFGFLVAPSELIPKLERMIRATVWNTPATMTAIACAWLADGTVARLEQAKRRDAMTRQNIAAKVFEGMHVIRHRASYFLWLPLPEDVRADAVALTLHRQGVLVSTAAPFSVGQRVPHALRVALGSVDQDTLRQALSSVRNVIERA